jgi:RNA-directed DNA polymerase
VLYDLDFLAEAWLRAKGNAGSRTPGIDKVTAADIENHRIGVGAFLEQVRGLLKSGGFRPEPVRQVMIPKKSGKLRRLGIATDDSYCPSCERVSGCFWIGAELCWSGPRWRGW